MARKIEIEVTGDTRNLERALGKAQKSASGFEDGMKKASKGALVALGGLAVGAAFSVKAASDLSEQMNKTAVVFRGSEKGIQAWSETTASAFGISQRAALEAAGTFGNMLVPMGLARSEAGKMSQRMVELAADMASFNNASPEETLEALRSGLAGETEPLRKFGIFLNEARIKEQAMRMGLLKQGGVLTAAAKAQATYAIILKDTTDSQGDFERTSDSLANQQRILKAELEDTAASLGTALIPAATAGADALLTMVNAAKDNETAFKILVGTVGGLSAAIVLANSSLNIYNSTLLTSMKLSRGLRIAMAVTPWLAAVAAAGFLVEALMKETDQADKATDAQNDLARAIRNYHAAAQEGKDASRDLEAASLRLESANIAVKRAVQDRTRVQKDDSSTLLDIREAELRVAQAMAERRDATDGVTEAQNKANHSQHLGKQASDEMDAATTQLTQSYRKMIPKARDGSTVVGDLASSHDLSARNARRAAANVDGYASKLRGMANATRDSNPQLARTQELMATLSTAWQRIVDMPSAKSFVARFAVITTVEEHRQEMSRPRAAGGPVTKGAPYIVGEYRPEIFVPSESGRIVPRVPQATAVGGGSRGSYVVMGDQEFVNWLRRIDGNERRRNGGRGVL